MGEYEKNFFLDNYPWDASTIVLDPCPYVPVNSSNLG